MSDFEDGEIALLRARLSRLERTVEALIELAAARGILTAEAVRERATSSEDAPAARSASTPIGHPYRDQRGPPVDASTAAASDARTLPHHGSCCSCGKPLARDEPELSLGPRGRACLGCYASERNRG